MSETSGPEDLERRSEREILLGDRMAALGRLAASVAHEVRNPLGAIDIQLQLLQEELRAGSGERAGERLDTARAELRRLDRIVQNFLRFSRPPALHLARVSLAELLGRLRELIEPEARERGIALELRREEEGDPVIDADENLLSQAFLNLLINALQAYDGSGSESRGSPARVAIGLRAANDRSALVTIGDRGAAYRAATWRGSSSTTILRRTRAPDWGSPSPNGSSTSTRAASKWRARREREPRCPFAFPSRFLRKTGKDERPGQLAGAPPHRR